MTELPDAEEACALAAGVSSLASEAARALYQDDRRVEIENSDRRLDHPVVPGLVSGAHVLAGQLLLAAGDFIHGIHGLLLQHNLDLAYSTAGLARSASEYAAKAWWLIAPGTTHEEQACRSVALVRESLRQREKLNGPSQEVENMRGHFREWESEHGLTAGEGPLNTLDLMERILPGDGGRHWRHLCEGVHGNVLSVFQTHHFVTTGHSGRLYQDWFRVIVATRYVLVATQARCAASGRVPEHLADIVALHTYRHLQLDAWLDGNEGD